FKFGPAVFESLIGSCGLFLTKPAEKDKRRNQCNAPQPQHNHFRIRVMKEKIKVDCGTNHRAAQGELPVTLIVEIKDGKKKKRKQHKKKQKQTACLNNAKDRQKKKKNNGQVSLEHTRFLPSPLAL